MYDLDVYCAPIQQTLPTHMVFTDGSYHPEFGCSSVAIVNGMAYACKPQGYPSPYKGEMIAMFLAAYYATHGSTINCDCKGVISAVQNQPVRVTLGKWVHRIRQLLQSQHLAIRHVKAHIGILGNEIANTMAQKSNVKVPISPPQTVQYPFDVLHVHELMTHPHKTWTKHYIPSHKQDGIWTGSFRPLKKRFRIWFKWLYACKWADGFDSYFTYWYPPDSPQHQRSQKLCRTCLQKHNLSIHGYLAFCSTSHPIVNTWLQSWPPLLQSTIARWRETASAREKFLLGKLTIPLSLYQCLREQLKSGRLTRKNIIVFQDTIATKLNSLLPPPTYGDKRPNPFDPTHWYRPPPPRS